MKRNVINGCSLLMSRDLTIKALPILPNFLHDYWLALLACSYGPIIGTSERLVLYRQHNKQLTGARIACMGKAI